MSMHAVFGTILISKEKIFRWYFSFLFKLFLIFFLHTLKSRFYLIRSGVPFLKSLIYNLTNALNTFWNLTYSLLSKTCTVWQCFRTYTRNNCLQYAQSRHFLFSVTSQGSNDKHAQTDDLWALTYMRSRLSLLEA